MTPVLSGVRVIETANFISGPYIGHLLGEAGAEVIKIENPKGGDPFRNFKSEGYSAHFCAYNMNKKSVSLDISAPSGKAAFLKLVETADILIENFRPGVMDRLGLGWDTVSALNPRLIYCAVTGFGQSGPYKHRPAYDTVAAGISGLLTQFLSPENPRIVGPALADCVTGLYACQGVLGALYERERTDCGRRVDVAMVEAVVAFTRDTFANFFVTGKTPGIFDRPAASQSYAFSCADGKLVGIHLSSPEKFWVSLTQAIGRPQLATDERFDKRMKRTANFEQLHRELAEVFRLKPRADWLVLLDRYDIPFAPINDCAEVIEDPQIQHLGTFIELQHPKMGTVMGISQPIFYDNTRQAASVAPPTLGEHTFQILQDAGFTERQLKEMNAAGII